MTPDEAAEIRSRFDTRRQAEEWTLARPLHPAAPIDFSRVSARERERALSRLTPSPEGAALMPKIHVQSVERIDADTTRITLDVDHRPGAERRVVGVAEDLALALEDGKISIYEGMGLIARAAGV